MRTDTLDDAAIEHGMAHNYEGLHCDSCGNAIKPNARRWLPGDGSYHCSVICAQIWIDNGGFDAIPNQ